MMYVSMHVMAIVWSCKMQYQLGIVFPNINITFFFLYSLIWHRFIHKFVLSHIYVGYLHEANTITDPILSSAKPNITLLTPLFLKSAYMHILFTFLLMVTLYRCRPVHKQNLENLEQSLRFTRQCGAHFPTSNNHWTVFQSLTQILLWTVLERGATWLLSLLSRHSLRSVCNWRWFSGFLCPNIMELSLNGMWTSAEQSWTIFMIPGQSDHSPHRSWPSLTPEGSVERSSRTRSDFSI